ncbi:MAG: DUF4922 domain-containing protein [Bacteroidales bacterium]|nr:DUF4922 domain-containing protein [Bacteroidales bacterium]
MKYDVDDLLQRQFAVSEHYRKVFSDLENVRTRIVDFDGFSYLLQFNPGRIGSATADTKKKVTTDNCFLCEAHRFPGQIALEYDEQYNILVNPYPIFRKHFTIVDKNHVPQEIVGEEAKMVQMAEDLPGYTVFYNSRNSGASAPFHRHFQACETYELPVFTQWEALMQKNYKFKGDKPFSNGYGLIFDGTRYMYLINTHIKEQAIADLTQILSAIQLQCNSESPEANVGIAVEDGYYRIVIFPRSKHRPQEYFNTGDDHYTISPGFADMAGLIPCAVENDFIRLDKERITSIFTQVTLQPLIPNH